MSPMRALATPPGSRQSGGGDDAHACCNLGRHRNFAGAPPYCIDRRSNLDAPMAREGMFRLRPMAMPALRRVDWLSWKSHRLDFARAASFLCIEEEQGRADVMWWTHRHRWQERYGGLYADEVGGPRTIHEIWWECECGAVLDRKAKDRAAPVAAEREKDTPA